MEVQHQLEFIVNLDMYVQNQSYNRDVTPGDEDEIARLIEELKESKYDEMVSQNWLEKNADDLELGLQELMVDQSTMASDLKDTEHMLKQALDRQKSYLDSIDLDRTEVEVAEEALLMDQSYIDFLTTMFTLLIIIALVFSLVTGGVCAYGCNRKFCRNQAKANFEPSREANTKDMQVITGNSPPASPQLRLPGQDSQPKFGGLHLKQMQRE